MFLAVPNNALSKYDWFSLCNETSVDAALDRLNAAVTQAIDLAVPSRHIKERRCTAWFSGKLKAYFKKYFYRNYNKLKIFLGQILFPQEIV
jgi:hypothetical protein